MSKRKRFNKKPGSKAPNDLYKRTYGIYRIRGKRHVLERLGRIWLKETGEYSFLSPNGFLEIEVSNNFEFSIMETMCQAAGLKYTYER